MRKSQPPSGSGRVNVLDFDPTWDDRFKEAWAEAELLANDGWELVSVAPETCARVTMGDGSEEGLGAVAVGWSYTAGYMLAFRRPKP